MGTQRKRQNYPPTRRQNIYTKVGRRFIYYAKSVGHTMLLVLDTLAAAQSKLMSPCLWQDMWRKKFMNINKNSNKPPVCNTQMGTTRLWCQTSVGTQRKRQNYPPTRRQNIYTKVGRRFYLLCKISGPHHAVSVRHLSGGTIKINRRHKISRAPFTLLMRQKPRYQV